MSSKGSTGIIQRLVRDDGDGIEFTRDLTQTTRKSWAVGCLPRPPNVRLSRALGSLLVGIWGILKGSWGVLVYGGSLFVLCSLDFGFWILVSPICS